MIAVFCQYISRVDEVNQHLTFRKFFSFSYLMRKCSHYNEKCCLDVSKKKRPISQYCKIIYNEQKYSEFCYQLSLAICWLRRYIKFFFETSSKYYLKLEYCLKVKSPRWHTSAMFMTNWYF